MPCVPFDYDTQVFSIGDAEFRNCQAETKTIGDIRGQKCDEILGLNEAKAFYTRPEKAHSDRYVIRMQ